MKIKQLWSPKRGGGLLNGKGLSSSDDYNSRSEESSSSLPKKKSYFYAKLFRRSSTRVTTEGDDGGYESDGSSNSNRSTSSSFLRYNNKFLKLKSVFERRGDGCELLVQSKSKLPLFDRIYNRQNTIDDNYASDESDEDNSAPVEIVCDEIICSELVEPSASFVDIEVAAADANMTQESGEATGEGLKAPQDEQSLSKAQYPTQHLTQTLPSVTTEQHQQQGINAKPSRSQRKKKRTPKTAGLLAPVPISIPRTISYSLRSAISDGSKRERNSHSLMERRAFRVNGSHIDTSYWSHTGKRAYMEGSYLCKP